MVVGKVQGQQGPHYSLGVATASREIPNPEKKKKHIPQENNDRLIYTQHKHELAVTGSH